MDPSKEDAHRWFAAHDGQLLTTVQVSATGSTWTPELRRLHVGTNGRYFFSVDGRAPHTRSELRIEKDHKIIKVDPDHITIDWFAPEQPPRYLGTVTYSVPSWMREEQP